MTNTVSPRRAVQKRKALFLPLMFALLLLGPLLGPVVLQATEVVAHEWVIEHVESVSTKQFSAMTNRSLRLDADGHPHIAYGEEHLYHAWHDGTSWHYEMVDGSLGVGKFASLALDANGYPHISYHDDTNQQLKYAYRDTSGWHFETIDGGGWHNSLAVDENGYPHISYPGPGGNLNYAYKDAYGWHIEIVDTEWGGHTSLALGSDGYPHVSYYNWGGSGYLKYAYQDASGWHVEIVEAGVGEVESNTSLALNESGYPHISYRGRDDLDRSRLKYAYQNDSGWHFEIVDREGWVSKAYSLALDEEGYPHISYESYYKLQYAYQDAYGWHFETVGNAAGNVGKFNSLALDAGGYPHIGYRDTDDLKYAYCYWLNWRDPDHLLLPSRGAMVDVVYGNIRTSTTLTATLSGPAIFADGSQVLSADITDVSGSYALQLKPAEGATPGDTFALEVTLAGLRLERVGAIAWEVYLPLVVKAY